MKKNNNSYISGYIMPTKPSASHCHQVVTPPSVSDWRVVANLKIAKRREDNRQRMWLTRSLDLPQAIAERREENRLRMRRKRLMEPPEATAKRREDNRHRMRIFRSMELPEAAAERRKENRQRMREKRLMEPPEVAAERRAENRQRMRLFRSMELSAAAGYTASQQSNPSNSSRKADRNFKRPWIAPQELTNAVKFLYT